jgi:hypothetical protein
MPETPANSRNCLNCGQPFGEPRPRFCPACGQESNVRPPRIGEFVQQFGGAYFATEGALWRTLALLLFIPGELTRRYLAGRRKHYVLPLRLYLSISVVVLLLMRLLAPDNDERFFKFDFDIKQANGQIFALGDSVAGVRDGRFFCEGMPAWVCKRLQRRFDVDADGMRRQAAELSERFMSNLGAALFVMLPMFALWLKLAWLNRRLRYTEHLVMALHLHAFWFVMLGLTLANSDWLNTPAFFAVPLYTLLALKRVYGGRWWPRLLRAALVTLLYGITLALVMFGMVLVTLLS